MNVNVDGGFFLLSIDGFSRGYFNDGGDGDAGDVWLDNGGEWGGGG